MPVVFTPEFFDDGNKKKQWAAFLIKNRSYVPEMSLESVCKEIAAFLMRFVDSLNGNVASPTKVNKALNPTDRQSGSPVSGGVPTSS